MIYREGLSFRKKKDPLSRSHPKKTILKIKYYLLCGRLRTQLWVQGFALPPPGGVWTARRDVHSREETNCRDEVIWKKPRQLEKLVAAPIDEERGWLP